MNIPRRGARILITVVAALAVSGLAGCGGGQGSNTDCGLDGCLVAFPRSGDATVSVLGISARLTGVDAGQATIEVAGQTVTVPVGGEVSAQGFLIGVDSVTESDVIVRVRPGG